MKAIDLARRALRSLFSARARTVLTALAIATGTFALTLTLAASNGAKQYANNIVNENFNPSELIVTADSDAFSSSDTSKPQVYDSSYGSTIGQAGATQQIKMLTNQDLTTLRGVRGVSTVRPAISLNLSYITRDGQKQYVATATAYSNYKTPALLAGSIPTDIPNGSVILPQGFLSALGFTNAQQAIGKTVRIAVSKQADTSTLVQSFLSGNTSALTSATPQPVEEQFNVIAVTQKPSTLIQPGTELYLKLNETDLERLNNEATQGTTSYQKYLSAYADVTDGKDTAQLNAAQSRIKQLGYGAQSVLDTEKTITQVITVLQGIVTVFGLIAVVASVFGVVNTMYISVLQRTREIGLMKALGMHKRDINRLFLFEAGLLGFLGGLLGSVLATVLGVALNPVISRKLGLGSTHLLVFEPLQIVLLIAALMLVAIIAGLFPARKAARLDPINALRTE